MSDRPACPNVMIGSIQQFFSMRYERPGAPKIYEHYGLGPKDPKMGIDFTDFIDQQ